MSTDSIHWINARAALHCFPDHNRNQAHTMNHTTLKSLSRDYRCWTETSAEEIGACLENPQHQPLELKGGY